MPRKGAFLKELFNHSGCSFIASLLRGLGTDFATSLFRELGTSFSAEPGHHGQQDANHFNRL